MSHRKLIEQSISLSLCIGLVACGGSSSSTQTNTQILSLRSSGDAFESPASLGNSVVPGNNEVSQQLHGQQSGSSAALASVLRTTVVGANPATSLALAHSNATSVADASTPQLGFYDVDAKGAPRALRNDLRGSLTGQVQFAQSHTIDPKGNLARNMPSLVAQRAALLLFSPTVAINQASVTVSANGRYLGKLPLNHPNLLPPSDYSDNKGRPDVVYTRKAWSVELPWNWIQPGLALRFEDGQGKVGELDASNIELAPAAEMVVHSIRLGMLAAAPVSNNHTMLLQPELSAADYFQTLPLSRLVMAKYETVKLDRTIVASGEIYTTASKDNGGTYDGDMRENVAKAQVSTGINLANFGISSSLMNQNNPQIFNRRTIHHAQGMYANGLQGHGLSGGNGMATLYKSNGNELSHEFGHSYGLGHYPGADFSEPVSNDKLRNASHHAESGWGYMAHRKRMRANLHWMNAFGNGASSINGKPFTENFAGQYLYNTDAMAGGEIASNYSMYTHHTGYSAARIQTNLTRQNKSLDGKKVDVPRPVPDATFPSGYKSWSNERGGYVDARLLDANFKALAPLKVGVPVFTLLGGYNPGKAGQTLMYPAFRSNYGNVFRLPAPDTTPGAKQCWMQVRYATGKIDRIKLEASDGVKQFQINLEEAAKPKRADLMCQTGGVETILASLDIAQNLPPMEPAVVVGEAQGFEALRRLEVQELDKALAALAGSTTPILDNKAAMLLESWRDNLHGLSASSLSVAQRIFQLQAQSAEVERFINHYRSELESGQNARREQLAELLKAQGMVHSSTQLLPTGDWLSVDGGRCLKASQTGNQAPSFVVLPTGQCAKESAQRWFRDARNAIHSEAFPGMCLTSGGTVSLKPCDARLPSQVWTSDANKRLHSLAESNRCLDLSRSTANLLTYNCHDGRNQLWSGPVATSNAAMVVLNATQLDALYRWNLR